MDENTRIVFFVTIAVIVAFFLNVIRVLRSKQKGYVDFLENEIFKLKEKVLEQQKIIKAEEKSAHSALSLQQTKKIETLEAELQRQKERVVDAKLIAQEANRVKSEFLLNIRHEIRTPMNSIIVFAELLLQEKSPKKVYNYAKNIYKASKKLLEMIDDIIELSRVENGTFTLEEKAVDLKALIHKIIRSQKEKADKKGLEIIVDIESVFPDALMLDEKKVENICQNLIENAVKFTEKGFVRIQLLVNKKDIVTNSVDISLVVEDSGEGIDEEMQGKIFEIFENSGEKGKERGMGLGLSINRKIAKQMQGDIVLESKKGKGSCFIFTIKSVEIALTNTLSASFHEEMVDFSLLNTDKGSIVVIDEDSESREIIKSAFAQSALKIFLFDNPRGAIELLKKERVEAVFIDIDILTSDDNAVAKMLKSITVAPVVTLTQKRIKDFNLQKSGLQIAGHLKKPLLKSELFKIALQILNNVSEEEQKNFFIVEKEEDFKGVQKSQAEKFFKESSRRLESLYEEANRTNDLQTIESFAKELLMISKECNIEHFRVFAESLLSKVDLFEIDSINSMMQEYKQKISLLKDSVV